MLLNSDGGESDNGSDGSAGERTSEAQPIAGLSFQSTEERNRSCSASGEEEHAAKHVDQGVSSHTAVLA
jgi:hypothetical protein